MRFPTRLAGRLCLAIVAVPALAAVPQGGAPVPVRVVEDKGFQVRLDLRPQVLGIDAPERTLAVDDQPISPLLEKSPGGFVSAAMLVQKAKQFDDGLYAAVELAAQNGLGRFSGKVKLLEAVGQAMVAAGANSEGNVARVILAANQLGGHPIVAPDALQKAVDDEVRAFLADPKRSKPLGFYPWSEALANIFRQDRMLQSELVGKEGIEALARALQSDPKGRATYESYLNLIARLTNPLAGSDLRGALRTLSQRPGNLPDRGVSFFPASRSHESDLVLRLFGNRPVPAGFSLIDEMIKRIKSRELVLMPTPQSGWYDYQTWSLEPLVVPERVSEAVRLRLSEDYRDQLIDLFKATLALTRETHVKQLMVAAAVGAMMPPPQTRPEIMVYPELSTEPLASHYVRRARSYYFVQVILEGTFGPDALRQVHRLTAKGPVDMDLAAELEQMQGIFFGASATVSHELAMPVATNPGRSIANDVATFRKFSAGAADDPDLNQDVRMMVPVFFDKGRGKTKVWAVLGWTSGSLIADFAIPPNTEVFQNGRRVDANAVDVKFGVSRYPLATPVFAEVYVTNLLDRDEFRKHCDQYKTREAILKNLK